MLAQPNKLSEQEERLEEVILSYLQAVDSGQTPDPEQLLLRHPDLTTGLKAFFGDQNRLDPFLAPLRELAPPTPVPDCPLRSFGDYEVLETIARGGMGVVCKARQISLNRPVALKVIRNRYLANGGDLRRFRTEAENAAQLDHPHIVPIYEVGEWWPDGESAPVPFFSMKLIEGGSLAQQRQRFTADPRASAALLATVARAVHHAHQRGILHRDLKPANILLDAEGRPHVSDFGLAKRIETEGGLTQSGVILGTPEYMAPEQARAAKGLTTAADVYGLGAVLYELLTGRPPFRGDNIVETLRLVAETEPARPRTLNPKGDRDLETICLKCLNKEPGRRYGSAEALAEDLERWLKGEPILARPITLPQWIWLWCKRNRLLASMMGTAALGLLAAFAILIVSNITISRQTQIAENARILENTQRLQAEASAGEANRQKEIADLRRRQAEKAVDRLLTRVARTRVPGIPGLTSLRLAMMQDALELNEEFAQETGDDPGVRLRVASSSVRVATLQKLLGRKEAAEKTNLRANALFEKLVADFPTQTVYVHEWGNSLLQNAGILFENGNWPEAERMNRQVLKLVEKSEGTAPQSNSGGKLLATAHGNLGVLLSSQGQFGAAEQSYRLSLDWHRKLIKQAPNDLWERCDAANQLFNLADVLDDLNKTEEANKVWQEARAEHKKIVQEANKVHYFKSMLAKNCTGFANHCKKSGRTKEAEDAYQEALKLGKELVADFSEIPAYRRSLGNTLNSWALLCSNSEERVPLAEEAFRQAIQIRQQLLREDPKNPDYESELAATLHNQVFVLQAYEKFTEACQNLEEAIRHQRAALQMVPSNATYRRFLKNHYQELGATRVMMGLHREASLAAEELPKLDPKNPEVHHHAAGLLAQCAGIAKADKKLPEPQRQAASEAHARRAVELLKSAILLGFKNVQEVKLDPNFKPLLGREDFNKVVAGLEGR
jgi:tetratricopeptide (TPR) repeat protein